jgi:AcrR family transcriptional regulator
VASRNTAKSKIKQGQRSGYNSPLRARQAAETRLAMVNAAVKLFSDQGWAATSLPMIAAEAGTAVDTIYSAFGTKSGLLMAAIDLAIIGDDGPTPMVDRPEIALFSQGSKIERIRTGVRFTIGVYERSIPILKALQEAARSDDTARARLAQYDDDRRNVIIAGTALILGRPAPVELVDAVWALVSPEVFTMLTKQRGWSIADTEAWLVKMSKAAIDNCAALKEPNLKSSSRSQ